MTSGPSGAAAASQMNSPGFSFAGSVPTGEDSFAPQKGTGAATARAADKARAVNPGTRRLRRDKLPYRVTLSRLALIMFSLDFRGPLDRRADAQVGAAPAEVVVHRGADLVVSGPRRAAQERR